MASGEDDVRSTKLERRVVVREGAICAGGEWGGDSPFTKAARSAKSPSPSKGSGDSDPAIVYCEKRARGREGRACWFRGVGAASGCSCEREPAVEACASSRNGSDDRRCEKKSPLFMKEGSSPRSLSASGFIGGRVKES